MEKKKALLFGSVLVLCAAFMAAGFMTAEDTGFFGGMLEDAVGFCMQYMGVAYFGIRTRENNRDQDEVHGMVWY